MDNEQVIHEIVDHYRFMEDYIRAKNGWLNLAHGTWSRYGIYSGKGSTAEERARFAEVKPWVDGYETRYKRFLRESRAMKPGVMPPAVDLQSDDEAIMAAVPATLAILHAAWEIEVHGEDVYRKPLEQLAMSLPVWDAWAKDVRGFGAASLGRIVGECGDLNNYASKSKVWKRMGLAVMDDGRAQRRVKDKALAEEAGFNPRRRAVMHVIGDVLMKQNPHYHAVYTQRRESLMLRDGLHLDPKKGVVDEDGTYVSIHKHALRYIEKQFLRDLWQAWRGSDARDLDVAA